MSFSDPSEQQARKRLYLLELASKLGNVSEACRQSGVDRVSFYIWKKRFEERGLDGLKDLPHTSHSRPAAISLEIEKKILSVSLRHPEWGCKKVSEDLAYWGRAVSSPTVQKIFIKHSMASILDRVLRLEKKHFNKEIKLNKNQIEIIEKFNPIFRERNEESREPGELLCQAVKCIGTINGIGKILAHFVVDTFNSYGFAFLQMNKDHESAIMLLERDVFPKYREWKVEIQTILTNTSRTFSNPDEHPYQDFLWDNHIGHRKIMVHGSETNGFVERFIHTLKIEFVPDAFQNKKYSSIEELQQELDRWLHHYNYEKSHYGYRNMGKKPADLLQRSTNLLSARHHR